jgi:hypothetical protein
MTVQSYIYIGRVSGTCKLSKPEAQRQGAVSTSELSQVLFGSDKMLKLTPSTRDPM